jgi:lysyl-tRNA synthetase class 2
VELSEEEKTVLEILRPEQEMELGQLKQQAGLSNKKWDKTTKSLKQKGLMEVAKTDVGLLARTLS